MTSPLNRRHRRTAPYVVVNNHTQPPSVAYSARLPDQENLTNVENNIQVLSSTLNEQTQPTRIQRSATSLVNFARRAQVCLIIKIEFIFSFSKIKYNKN